MGNAEIWWELFQKYASKARHHKKQLVSFSHSPQVLLLL